VTGAELRVIEGPDAGQRVELSQGLVVGRDHGSADFVLEDDQVSRRHVQVAVEDGVAVLQDLGSTNGTYLDGQLVSGTARLSPGARIQLGNTVIEYALPLEATAPREIVTDFEQHTRARPIPPPPAEAGAPAPASAAAPVEPAAALGPPAAAAPAQLWNGIEVYGLVREFKGGFRAVNELYLQVHPGEIYGFLGPNGAGKSTTVHMLVTLLPPTGGTAHVAGYDVAANPADVRRAIGVALQEASLDPLLNAYEHMELQCAMQGLPRSEWQQRGAELIERVGLTEAADRRSGGYSGGMRRRLDLALSLVHRPRILFLDEPTTGLDPKSRGDLWDEVAHLAKDEGVTVFLTTQYLEEADVLADRIGIIDRGQLVAEGTPEQLKAEIGRPTADVTPYNPADAPALAAVLGRFGEPAVSARGVAVRLRHGPEVLPEIVRAIDDAGLRMGNLELHQPSLDDVFLQQTGRSLEEQTLQESGKMPIPPLPAAVASQGAARG
jgi:ABC-2 type transport system ATP-binding protein